jgi:hypothetical protein
MRKEDGYKDHVTWCLNARDVCRQHTDNSQRLQSSGLQFVQSQKFRSGRVCQEIKQLPRVFCLTAWLTIRVWKGSDMQLRNGGHSSTHMRSNPRWAHPAVAALKIWNPTREEPFLHMWSETITCTAILRDKITCHESCIQLKAENTTKKIKVNQSKCR